jgi:hypothetical protein
LRVFFFFLKKENPPKPRLVLVLTCVLRPPFVLTLATVQEVRRCVVLLYSLSRHMAAWKLRDIGTALSLEEAVLSFVTQTAFLLSRPETLAQYCRPGRGLDGPIAIEERSGEGNEPRAVNSRNTRKSSIFRASSVASGGTLGGLISDYKSTGTDSVTGMSFPERMQCELFDVVRACLAFCRNDSPTLWKYGAEQLTGGEPLKLRPIFGSALVRPVSMSDSATIGSLDLLLATLAQQLGDYLAKGLTEEKKFLFKKKKIKI